MIPHFYLIGKILIIAADLFYHTVMRKDEDPDLTKMEAELRKWKKKQLARKLKKIKDKGSKSSS